MPAAAAADTAAILARYPLLDRDASILDFNHRVLHWAERPDVPLLERLRYLCIVSSNLDEFNEVRAAPLVTAMRSAIEQGAWAQAQRSSHTLKGLCAQLGGLRAAEAFKDVNLRLKQGLSVQQAEAVVLSKEYKDLAAALQQWLVSSSS